VDRRKNMKIGFTCGTFDLMHIGHILMFKECKSVCDYLIVGIQTDPTIDRPKKNKPIQSIVERQVQVKACRYVDEVIVYETEKDLEDILSSFDINIRILGIDHKDGFMTGKEICERRGIEMYYNKRDHNFSTTNLRERIKEGDKKNG
jgi:glycerol-3-phosphate cytidylyltransferase